MLAEAYKVMVTCDEGAMVLTHANLAPGEPITWAHYATEQEATTVARDIALGSLRVRAWVEPA